MSERESVESAKQDWVRTDDREDEAKKLAYARLEQGIRFDQAFRDTIWWGGLLAVIGAAAGWLTQGPHDATDAFWATIAADALLFALIRATLAKTGSIVGAAGRMRQLERNARALPALELEAQHASRWIAVPSNVARRLGTGRRIRVGQSQTYAWYYGLIGLAVAGYWLWLAFHRNESPAQDLVAAVGCLVVVWNAFRLAVEGAGHEEDYIDAEKLLPFRRLLWPFGRFAATGGPPSHKDVDR